MTLFAVLRNGTWLFAYALVAITLSSCGIENENYDFKSEYAAKDLKVAVVPESGAIRLYLAGDLDAQSVTICEWQDNSCKKTVLSVEYRRSTERKFFRAQEVISLSNDSTWLIAARQQDGSEVTQKIRIAAVNSGGSVVPGAMEWKMVLMASDQGNQSAWISAFDNARIKLKLIFQGFGVRGNNIQELSLHPKHQNATVKPTNIENFTRAVHEMGVAGTNDACLVHMTSHGARNGFALGNRRLSPAELGSALDRGCGDRPTVVLVSACFSGLYVQDSSGLKKPNRVILTAARHDRTSFGCSPENEFTYWDNCLIDNLPLSETFRDLAGRIDECIRRKEGGTTASIPQTFIGEQVSALKLPGK